MRNPFARSAPGKLWRHINKRQRRPTLPGGLSTVYDKKTLKTDEAIVMMMAGARDQAQAAAAMEGYNTALDWIKDQPARGSRRAARLISWLRRMLGYYEHDPLTMYEPVRTVRLKVRFIEEKDLR